MSVELCLAHGNMSCIAQWFCSYVVAIQINGTSYYIPISCIPYNHHYIIIIPNVPFTFVWVILSSLTQTKTILQDKEFKPCTNCYNPIYNIQKATWPRNSFHPVSTLSFSLKIFYFFLNFILTGFLVTKACSRKTRKLKHSDSEMVDLYFLCRIFETQ